MSSTESNVVRLPPVAGLSVDDCRLLVESVVDYAIFMLDVDGRVATWNRGAERIKGYKASEILGSHFSRFYAPEDVSARRPERALALAIEHGHFEDEGWRVRNDGTRFWANVVITALRDETGRLRGFGKVTRDLTARRRVEEELRDSEERFRLLVEGIPDYAIYMLDTEGRITTWNRGAERLKGYRSDEVLGKHFAIFFPKEDRAADKPARELAVARELGRFEDEGWRVRRTGERFWANAILTAVRDAHGELVGFAKITRDLTSRREAEQIERHLLEERAARAAAEDAERRLRESEERFRGLSRRLEMILEGVADGITVQDRSGKVIFANGAAAQICGFASTRELIDTPPREIVSRFQVLDEQGRPFDLETLPGRRVLNGEPTSSALLHVRELGSGREWWSSVRASSVAGPGGKPELAINIWHDVSAERRLERQSKYLATATAALGISLEYDEMLATLARVLVPGLGDWCSIFVLDGDELRSVAVAHCDQAKLDAAKEFQRRFLPLREERPAIWRVIRSGVPELHNDISDDMLVAASHSPEHLALLRTVGMKAILLAPIRIRDRNVGVISLVSAESDRRYDESQLQLLDELGRRAGVALENAQLYAAAQAAARAAEEASRAKDEFLATVSHELRTPLTAILGWSTLLRDRVSDPALNKPVEVIHRNAVAQVRIIDDILDVSRVITGKFRLEPKPADLVAIVRDAIEVVRQSAIARQIEIAFAPENEFCLLVADPERLQQVVWNLLSNAVKFTEPGGEIDVSLRQEGSTVSLSVRDTGKGIEPAFLPFVFDRFKQADSSFTRRVGGLGLGLALVRHIVELHGGRAVAASGGLGEGSTFTITLPIRAVVAGAPDRSSLRPSEPSSTQVAVRLDGTRVLVIDDEADARELIAAVLTDAGAAVETARSASEGFDSLQRFRPDVLVSDIGMPDEDGLSLMRRVRALNATEGGRIPSLALTAFAREEDRTRAIAAGYTTHIGKPVNPDALASAVANLASLFSRF